MAYLVNKEQKDAVLVEGTPPRWFSPESVTNNLVFLAMVAISAMAVLALLAAAPVVLCVSALASMLAKNGDKGRWRAARA